MPIDVHLKRIYDAPGPGDGYRVLIDHVWPRGVSRERAQLDEWARELAPSERFEEFRTRYRTELADRPALLELARRASEGPVTIVYAARDQQHNNAVVLAEVLRDPGRTER